MQRQLDLLVQYLGEGSLSLLQVRDQLFNNLVGREFQREEGKEGQVVIVTPLLVGTDGHVKIEM